jgi:siroheme synthase-like protein
MRYYPLFLDIKGKDVLVIGGGNIALEKINNLLKAGANITVIAPLIRPSVARFNRRITFFNRKVEDRDILEKYSLVFCATGESALNAHISKLCLEKRILCNTVDDPTWCHFIVPSIFRRGLLTVAISTSGVSPSLAQEIRKQLKYCIGPEVTVLTRWLAGFRLLVQSRIPTLSGRMAFWKRFYEKNPRVTLRLHGKKALEKKGMDLLDEAASHDR